jgi:4-carboxymuconolactone decarboxylase
MVHRPSSEGPAAPKRRARRRVHRLEPDRLPPIPAEEQTAEQRDACAAFKTNRGEDVFGPFVPLLRSPEVMLRAMAMGDYLRFRTVLPRKLNELVILITARKWSQEYEWFVHHPLALKEGLHSEIARDVAEGRRPDGMDAGEEVVYDFTTELLSTQRVSDATYARAVASFGEQGTIDMTSVAGFYTFIAMVLNTARTPLPPGAKPALPPCDV